VREDTEVSQTVVDAFRAEGIDVRLGHKAQRFELRDGKKLLVAEAGGHAVEIEFDVLLCALGRVANVSGYGLEELGIPLGRTRTVEVNAFLQTSYPNIYACGDVAGPYQFTHAAAHMAWYASVNALFGRFRRFRVDWSVLPWCTFTDPEVARVGLNEQDAREKGVDFEVTRYGIDDLDRAIADGAARGFVKVITPRGSDKVLGATIVGEHAGDLIVEFVAAMRQGFGLNRILGTIHIYPTLAEANKYAAGEWKRAHAPRGSCAWCGAITNGSCGEPETGKAARAAGARMPRGIAGCGRRSMKIVAVVPALDEGASIAACLAPLVREAARVIVVDGGSRDDTPARAAACGAAVLAAPRGRASQMNAGAHHAHDADALVFVHADTLLPAGWRVAVERALDSGARWGRFDVRLDSARPLLRVVESAMNARSRLTGICTGDQAIFVRRDAWREAGGYPSIELMEDIELSRRLGRLAGRPACLGCRAVVSARRWERDGVLRTIALMWLLRAMYFFGASPRALRSVYYARRA